MTNEQLEEAKAIQQRLKGVEEELTTVKNHFKQLKDPYCNGFTICCTNNGAFELNYNEEYRYNYEAFLVLQEKTLLTLKLELEKELESI